MNNKTLYIFDSPILFNILEELKNNLSFKIVYLNKKDYQRINFEELTNYLIIAINFREENKNVLIVDNLPIRITNLVEN